MWVIAPQSRPALCEDPMDCSPPDSCVHGISQARILEWVVIPFSRGSSLPGDQIQVSCIAGRFFTSWATWEPIQVHEWVSESGSVVSDSSRPHGLYTPWNSPDQNTGVGSLSLLQGIFPTQGSNPGLPHGRWILYQLGHKGNPWQKNRYMYTYGWVPLLSTWNYHSIIIGYESESEVSQSCPALCDPIGCSLPDSSIHGIFQARILEWVAISFSRRSSDPEIEPGSPTLQADALPPESPGKSIL